MKIVGFKYLRKQRLIALAFILTIASTLFSLTALSFFSFYKTINAYLGETENTLAIYDKKSTTPFTGLIPLQLDTHLKTIEGVLATSPETIAPAIIKSKSVIIRGIIPEEFSKLNPLTIAKGETIQLGDLSHAIAGKRLADTLKIAPNDRILVQGVLAERYIELSIKGVFESDSALDDEILAPLYVGQWLRGTNYDHVTMIRVKIDESKITPAQLFQQIAEKDGETEPDTETKPSPLSQILPSSGATLQLEKLGVEETSQLMKTYLDQYGMSPQTLLILSIIVFILANATIFTASQTLIRQHEPEITILRSLGLSRRNLKLDLAIKVLPWAIAASSIGTLISILALQCIEKINPLQAFSHTIHFQPDAVLIAVNFILVSTTAILALIQSTRKTNL
jgi:ABC-type lipoprotein release transport system permease subunit